MGLSHYSIIIPLISNSSYWYIHYYPIIPLLSHEYSIIISLIFNSYPTITLW